MPITNNIIQINNSAIRPVPEFKINYEKFESGHYVIGGIIVVQLNGKIIGSSTNDLNSKIKTISGYNGKCQTIKISCEDKVLIDGIGFIRNLNITSTDQPFVVNYTMDIAVQRNFGLSPIVPDQEFINLYELSIPNNLNLMSYEESIDINGDENLANVAAYGGGSLSKSYLKLSASLSMQAYGNSCLGSDDTNLIYNILKTRVEKIISLSLSVTKAYPVLANYFGADWTALNDTKNITIDQLNNRVDWKFDVYIVNGSCSQTALIDLNITENTDQSTGLSSYSVRGNIKGLNSTTSSALDNNVMASEKITNARNALSYILSNGSIGGSFYDNFLVGCFNPAEKPSSACYQRSSVQTTESVNSGQINFDLKYEDAEYCQLGGVTIDYSISEEQPTQKYVDFIIPGRTYPIIQVSQSPSAYTATLTTTGRMNSCNLDEIALLKNCVSSSHYSMMINKGFQNLILVKRELSQGKYSFRITDNYIGCI